jgi:hypothetical protein
MNRLSYWVATILLQLRRVADRALVLEKLAQVGRVLVERFRNFNAAAALVVGLGTAGVARLKHSFDRLPPQAQQDMEWLQQLMEPSNSYRRYRAALASSPTPLIPYV